MAVEVEEVDIFQQLLLGQVEQVAVDLVELDINPELLEQMD
jgi:hypothetical protein